jgi:hypothetical protein
MIYDVILSKKDNQYFARVKEWPEIMAYDKMREKVNNPWLDKFGWFKDDPTFDDLQTEIAAYRREIDKEMALG